MDFSKDGLLGCRFISMDVQLLLKLDKAPEVDKESKQRISTYLYDEYLKKADNIQTKILNRINLGEEILRKEFKYTNVESDAYDESLIWYGIHALNYNDLYAAYRTLKMIDGNMFHTNNLRALL